MTWTVCVWTWTRSLTVRGHTWCEDSAGNIAECCNSTRGSVRDTLNLDREEIGRELLAGDLRLYRVAKTWEI